MERNATILVAYFRDTLIVPNDYFMFHGLVIHALNAATRLNSELCMYRSTICYVQCVYRSATVADEVNTAQ